MVTNVLKIQQSTTFQDSDNNWVSYRITTDELDDEPAFKCEILTKKGWRIFGKAHSEIRVLAAARKAWNERNN